jgi:TM2 domain-containing membrane protein YozV
MTQYLASLAQSSSSRSASLGTTLGGMLIPMLLIFGVAYLVMYLLRKAKEKHTMLSQAENGAEDVPAVQLPPVRQIKSPGTAVLLSLFITGAGQIYNGEAGKGILLMILQIICVALTPTLYFPAIPVLILWIYSSVNAQNVAIKINEEAHQREVAPILEARRTAEAEKTMLRADVVADALVKAHRLFQHQMLSSQEFTSRKEAIIQDLKGEKLANSAEDFLLAMIPLVDSGVLTQPELAQAKSILMGR